MILFYFERRNDVMKLSICVMHELEIEVLTRKVPFQQQWINLYSTTQNYLKDFAIIRIRSFFAKSRFIITKQILSKIQ